MDAVTYPTKNVIDFIEGDLVPLRVRFDAKPLADEFNVKWTPTLIVLDPKGKEHHRTVGFLPPEELIPSLMIGMAKGHFDQERFSEAISLLGKLLAEYPRSQWAPEGIYLLGVSKFKSTHEPKSLKEAYERLQKDYPSSEWARRASPYRLL